MIDETINPEGSEVTESNETTSNEAVGEGLSSNENISNEEAIKDKPKKGKSKMNVVTYEKIFKVTADEAYLPIDIVSNSDMLEIEAAARVLKEKILDVKGNSEKTEVKENASQALILLEETVGLALRSAAELPYTSKIVIE